MRSRIFLIVLLFLVSTTGLVSFTGRLAAEFGGGFDHVVIDSVRIPFGETVEVTGPCLTTDSFQLLHSYGAASVLGLRINGRANQENVAFHLVAPDKSGSVSRANLEKLRTNGYYKIRGRLMDARIHGRKSCSVVVDQIQAIPDAPLTFADFLDRVAEFEGTAEAGARFRSGAEVARLDGPATWPQGVEGKKVSVRGIVHRDTAGWQFEHATWNLIELADQLGETVSLNGRLLSTNDHWWFEYREEKLYVTTAAGPTMTFTSNEHGRLARVTGRLVRQLRPALNQISLKTDRDLVPCFVIRDATVDFPVDQSTWRDRFRTLYPTYPPVRDGVPELLAETGYRRNMLGNESTARLYAERNDEAMKLILRHWTPATADVLAARANDPTLPEPIRLLYATLLVRANDDRGRALLTKTVEERRPGSLADALFCLGYFPWIASDESPIETNVQWAEKTLIAVMSDRRPAEIEGRRSIPARAPLTSISGADAAVIYSEIPAVLMKINSAAARQVLIDYVLARSQFADSVTGVLCRSEILIPVSDLLKLESVTRNEGTRRNILSQLLRHKHPAAAERFLKDLEEGFTYMDFRGHSSPEVLASLRAHLKQLNGKALNHARMLLVLGEKDPVPAIVALLDDPAWEDKNLAFYELARLRDRRAVAPVARILREAPRGYLRANSDTNATHAVRNGLEAIAHAGTRASVRALIDLLPVDLARFGSYIDRAGFQRIVAGHLIELTGESFGVDADAWKKWLETQPVE